MKRINFGALCLIACVTLFSACGVYRTEAYSNQESVVVYNQLDGICVVRARGRATTQDVRGAARTRAMQAAEKKALYDVLFNVLVCRDCPQGKSLTPLVPEVNAARKYDSYFSEFFSDDGDWKNYAAKAGTRYLATKFGKTTNEYVCDMSVRIDRRALHDKLVQDGILKK